MARGREMKLRVLACRHVYSGKNKRGDEYVIYEVEAAKTDGSKIDEKLRAFTSLPIGQEVEVSVVPFTSDRYGRSFTLYPKGSTTGSVGEQVNEMRQEIESLQQAVRNLHERVQLLEGSNGTRAVEPPAMEQSEVGAKFGDDAPW